jgi:GT2 family glycosyltransferase
VGRRAVSAPDLSVVVVHHRGLDHLLEALSGVAEASRGLAVETLLVDNTGGRDLSEPFRRFPETRRVPANGNAGFAAGCRLGAEAARAPLLAFVNDDAVVERAALELLAAALDAAPSDVVAAAGRLTDVSGRHNDFSDGFLTFDGHAFADEVGRPIDHLRAAAPGDERLFASGGLMAVRREAFLSSGGFDDDYFAYLEDVDFGWRQWIFGSRIVAEPRAVARHRGGATGTSLGVFARGFLYERNAFATAFKNFDREHFEALMPAVLAAFLGRIAEMVAARNPGAAELERDPYRAAPTASKRSRAIAALFGIAPGEPGIRISDPLTVAHLKALLWIRRNRDGLAQRRREVQRRRRRSDREIFAKFPLRIVPTYPGDAAFGTAFFAEFLAGAPPLVRSTLDDIFEAGSRP